MVHLKFSPLDTVDVGIVYYDFHFDQTAQFNNPSITSKNAAQEVDFYSVWSPTELLTVSAVVGFAVPGAGLSQAAQAFVMDNGQLGRSVGRTTALAEVFAALKY